MPLTRVRFTVRRLMVAVVVVALSLQATITFLNNRGLRREVRRHERYAEHWSKMARRAGPGTVHSKQLQEVADMFLERARIYREAERTGLPPGPMPPWPVGAGAPDPPGPE
jgi:hypothetical protein